MSAPPAVNYKAIKEKNMPHFQPDFFFFSASVFLARMLLSAKVTL